MTFLDSKAKEFEAQLEVARQTKEWRAVIQWVRNELYKSYQAGKRAAQVPSSEKSPA